MPFRWIGCATVLLVIFCCFMTPWMRINAQDQDTKKEESKKKLEKFEKDLAEEKAKKAKTGTVILQVVVHKDCKIIVNEKEVPYEKFEVLMEFAGSSFIVNEMTYRSEVMTVLKLRSKE